MNNQILSKIFRVGGYYKIIGAVIFAVSTISIFAWVALASTIEDNFLDTSKIASYLNLVVGAGQVTLSTTVWTCGDALIDTRDGKAYSTVTIGSQCWMAENLNIGTMITSCTNGYQGACTTGGDTLQNQGTSCSAVQKYCFGDIASNCNTYGGLYQWDQAMCGTVDPVAQGICPAGWHLPTHDEFTTLERAVCTSGTCLTDFPYDTIATGYRGTNEGTTLKTIGATSFSARLAGYRNPDGSFTSLSSGGSFWSSLQSGSNAWSRNVLSGSAQVYRNTFSKLYGFSVRCLKN